MQKEAGRPPFADSVVANRLYSGCTSEACQPFGPLTTLN